MKNSNVTQTHVDRFPAAVRAKFGRLHSQIVHHECIWLIALLVIENHSSRHGTNPRHDLLHPERLHDIIVCSQLQPKHAIDLLGLGADEYHRDRPIQSSNLATQIISIHVRHHNVEAYEVRVLPLEHLETGLSISCGNGFVTLAGKDFDQSPPRMLIVFNH